MPVISSWSGILSSYDSGSIGSDSSYPGYDFLNSANYDMDIRGLHLNISTTRHQAQIDLLHHDAGKRNP